MEINVVCGDGVTLNQMHDGSIPKCNYKKIVTGFVDIAHDPYSSNSFAVPISANPNC